MPRIQDLFRSIRETVAANRILTPGYRKRSTWPVCLTCGREPYSVKVEDINSHSVEIRVKCGHKPVSQMTDTDRVFEDAVKVDIPIGTEREEHIKWALTSLRYFDPARPPK